MSRKVSLVCATVGVSGTTGIVTTDQCRCGVNVSEFVVQPCCRYRRCSRRRRRRRRWCSHTNSSTPPSHSFAHYLTASHALPLIHTRFASIAGGQIFSSHISFNPNNLRFFLGIFFHARLDSQQWPNHRVTYKNGLPRHVVKRRS